MTLKKTPFRILSTLLVPLTTAALAQGGGLSGAHTRKSAYRHAAAAAAAAPKTLPLNSPAVKARVDALMKKLTFSEKIQLLSGYDSMFTHPVPAEYIPAIKMSDASVGVRVWGPSTAYPASVALAATWDPALAYRAGKAIGRDARARGVNIVLGPGMDLTREPQCGRNFEYLGEDPTLAGDMAVAWIHGIQSERVAACAKHYAGNEQETNRMTVNSIIGKRALEELYLAPFRDAVEKGHVLSIMPAYNKLNGLYSTANPYLLTTMLRQHWGFKGVVMSDWGATHATVADLNAGLDLEMPSDRYFNMPSIEPALASGQVQFSTINEHVRRILRVMVAEGWLDHPQLDKSIPLNLASSRATALQEEREAIVLLKNSGILPLSPARTHTIVVLGPNATPAVTGGGGSSYTTPIIKPVSMLEAVQRGVPHGTKVLYIPYPIHVSAGGFGFRRQAAPEPPLPPLTPQETAEIRGADAVIACVGTHDSEGSDRPFHLPDHEDQYLQQVAAVNPKTIVVVNSGAGFAMPWLAQVDGLIDAWYPGENGNIAVADVIFGRLNPSGKLPDSFARHWKDAAAYGHYPGHDGNVHFAEGIYLGYRWFDSKHITPQFPFGFGLSYTTFAIRNIHVASSGSGAARQFNVSVAITNTGKRAGADVVQLYVRPVDSPVERTFQQMRAFQRVELAPGQTRRVDLHVGWQAFAYYNTSASDWQVPAGHYTLAVGDSSRNIEQSASVEWENTLMQTEIDPAAAEPPKVIPPPSAELQSALNGGWKVAVSMMGNTQVSNCSFQIAGALVSGTCSGRNGQSQQIHGTASGNTVHWTAASSFGRRHFILRYSGHLVSPTKMAGDMQIPAFNMSTSFNATRQ